jgi:hypothetical protein
VPTKSREAKLAAGNEWLLRVKGGGPALARARQLHPSKPTIRRVKSTVSSLPFSDLDRQCAKGEAAMPSAVRVKHAAPEVGVPIVTGLGPRNSCKDRHPPDAIVRW